MQRSLSLRAREGTRASYSVRRGVMSSRTGAFAFILSWFPAACREFAYLLAVVAGSAAEFYEVTSHRGESRDYGMHSRDLAMTSTCTCYVYIYIYVCSARALGDCGGCCLVPRGETPTDATALDRNLLRQDGDKTATYTRFRVISFIHFILGRAMMGID